MIEPILRAWEIKTGLDTGKIQISFDFLEGEVIDRNPQPNNKRIVMGSAHINLTSALNIKATVRKIEYPMPPSRIKFSPDFETLWNRYQGYLNGREYLQNTAYFCLTFCQNLSENRTQFGIDYRIDKTILDKIGFLSSVRGDASDVRKFSNQTTLVPLSNNERNWLEKAIRILIQRIGEEQHIASLPIITMSDLPPLP